MNRKKKKKIDIATDEEVAQFGGDPVEGRQSEAVSEEPTAEVEVLGADATGEEVNDWKDKYLRLKAEMANFQRRSNKDRAEALRYANGSLIKTILPAIDDLQRVIESGSQEGATAQAVADGAKMTLDNLKKHMREFHVEQIDAANQPFDPAVHEAMMEQPSPDHAERTVLQVLSDGYKLHDRVLRPAKVIVSKVVEEEQA